MSLLPTIDGRLFRLAQGNAQLPRSLLAACGANITHARVRDIARQADGTFALTLQSAKGGAGAEVYALPAWRGFLSCVRISKTACGTGVQGACSLRMRVCQVRRAGSYAAVVLATLPERSFGSLFPSCITHSCIPKIMHSKEAKEVVVTASHVREPWAVCHARRAWWWAVMLPWPSRRRWSAAAA